MQSSSPVATGTIFTFQIATDQAGQRLDKFIAAQFPSYSRTFLQEIITNRNVHINGVVASKPSIQLKENDQVEITFALPEEKAFYALCAHDSAQTIYKRKNIREKYH